MIPASGSIQSQPKTRANVESKDHEDGNSRIRQHVDDGCSHVVVAVRGTLCMNVITFLEADHIFLAGHPHMGREFVRLRDFVCAFEKPTPVGHNKDLADAIRPDGLDGDVLSFRSRTALHLQAENRRMVVLKNRKRQHPVRCPDVMFFLELMPVRVAMVMVSVGVMVVIAARENPGGCDVYEQAQARDRDDLLEPDRNGAEKSGDRLVADEDGDHRQDDGRGETCEVAELAGAEGEPGVLRMPPGIAVGDGGQQHRPGMGAHVQTVCDQRDGAEQPAPDNLQNHHGTA